MANIVKTNINSFGTPCHSCGLPLGSECVSMPAGNQIHNKRYCISCGIILGHVSKQQVLAFYADGHGQVNESAFDGFYERLAGFA